MSEYKLIAEEGYNDVLAWMPLPEPYREERTEEPMVDKELIENWRNMLKPSISSCLLKTNYEGVGEQDKEEFERDFDEILDLAFIGLKHRAQLLQERTEERTESLCKKVRALCEESKIEFFFVGGGGSTWSVTNDKHIKKIVECHKAQLSQEGTTKDATSDTISRQAAIDALKNERSDWNCDYNVPVDHCIDAIYSVPSVQPEIIRCRDCKFASGDSRICMKFGHSPIGELDFCAWAEGRTDEA